MQPFSTHRGLVAVLDRANVDTDQIIPKQFLKSIQRTGFGPSLFFDWRYDAKGDPDPAFILNADRYRGASILVVRNNFGCGSSREHAVWAVQQYGFRAVVAPRRGTGLQVTPGFADIFRSNAAKNGLLTVELSESEVETIFQAAATHPGLDMTIDLPEQQVVLHLPEAEQVFSFDIDPATKESIGRGLDDIAMTLEHESAIRAFEAKQAGGSWSEVTMQRRT